METPLQVSLCNGLTAWILWDTQQGVKPLIGAYYTPEAEWAWIPISWTRTGKYNIDEERQQKYCHLDIEWERKVPLQA